MAEWTTELLESYFRETFEECIELMVMKNRKYGSSWEADRPTTLTDTIRHKIDRIRSLESLGDDEAESIEDNLLDLINYSVFRKIKNDEDKIT